MGSDACEAIAANFNPLGGDANPDGGRAVPLVQMPGYATDEELFELSTLEGIALGRRWLELMRAHHVGGVHMAEEAAETATLQR